jgi:2-dehydropantoate 2-reductase
MAASLDALVAINRTWAKARSGVWRDLAVRKRKTEVETVAAELRARAHKHGRPIPLVDAVARMIGEIEAGSRSRDWDNIRALAHLNTRTYGAQATGEVAGHV